MITWDAKVSKSEMELLLGDDSDQWAYSEPCDNTFVSHPDYDPNSLYNLGNWLWGGIDREVEISFDLHTFQTGY